MKKIVWGFFSLLLVGIVLLNNPIESYWAEISELYFDANNNWYLEIELGTASPEFPLPIDSICLSSNSGSSKIKGIEQIKYSSFPVITLDSLYSPISINKRGDKLTLIIYPTDTLLYEREDTFIFGDQPGSIIDSINSGYSITCINKNYFTKDSSPSLGFPNDTCGVCATLTGFVYDKNQNLVTDTNLVLTYTLYFDETGRYTTKILSRKYGFSQIALWHSSYKVFLQSTFGASIDYLNIANVNFTSNPGDVIEQNIYLSDYISRTEQMEKSPKKDCKVSNYPNPFNSSTNFYITIPNELVNQEGYIKIYNVNGEEVKSISVKGNKTLQWQGTDTYGKTLPSGVYYYQLSLDNKVQTTGSMILLK